MSVHECKYLHMYVSVSAHACVCAFVRRYVYTWVRTCGTLTLSLYNANDSNNKIRDGEFVGRNIMF